MRVTAVAFDLDDTLAVTARPREELLADAAASAGAPHITRDEYLNAHARHLDTETREPIFADLLPEGSETSAGTLAEAYRTAILDALTPIDGGADMLDALRREYRVGLLTNGPVVAQRGKLAELGWDGRFDATVITGELDAGKPDRRAFEALLDALGTTPEETVYVGDNPEMDVRGAKAAGLRTVQVLYSGGPEPIPEADAYVDRDELVTRLPDVVDDL